MQASTTKERVGNTLVKEADLGTTERHENTCLVHWKGYQCVPRAFGSQIINGTGDRYRIGVITRF